MNCVHCEREAADSRDHVPPACLFPEPRPPNLITVPSCVGCNNGASDDDEYFKATLALRWDVYLHPAAQAIAPSVMRGLARPRKSKALRRLLASFRDVSIYTPSGLFVGWEKGADVDFARVERVLARIVRGIHFHARRFTIGPAYELFVAPVEDLAHHLLDGDVRNIVQVLLEQPETRIGDEIFAFRWQAASDDPRFSTWLLTFYSAARFFCIVGPIERMNERSNLGETRRPLSPEGDTDGP